MSAGETIAVLDAGPLIHLDQLGSLSLRAGYREVLLEEALAPAVETEWEGVASG